MLAGISADYYLRLEQGRDRNPSRQVLESIARVLQLDEDGAAYLLSLGVDPPRPSRRRARKESVPIGIRMLLDTLTLPAFVEGRYFDVLAANPLATALSPRLAPGGNRLRDLFLDPAEQDIYPDWATATGQMVAGFRESVGTDVEDPRFVELVGRLSLNSARFRELWARHDVAKWEGTAMTLDHPHVGELTLYREKLAITGTTGQVLVMYHPEPGTSNAAAQPGKISPAGTPNSTMMTNNPRNRAGAMSAAAASATGTTPPSPTPVRNRNATNVPTPSASIVSRLNTATVRRHTISAVLRPIRSPRKPNSGAPTISPNTPADSTGTSCPGVTCQLLTSSGTTNPMTPRSYPSASSASVATIRTVTAARFPWIPCVATVSSV